MNGATFLFLCVFGVFGVGALLVACILLLIERLRSVGQLARADGSVQAGAGSGTGRWKGRGTKAERQALLKEKKRRVLNDAKYAKMIGAAHNRHPKKYRRRGSKWWLPPFQRKHRNEYRDEQRVLKLDLEVGRRDSIAIDVDNLPNLLEGRNQGAHMPKIEDAHEDAEKAALLAATFCRSCRVLKWHDCPAPAFFDLRGGKFSYLVSPLLGGRQHPDDPRHVGSAQGPYAPSKSKKATYHEQKQDEKPRLLLTLVSLPEERTVASITENSPQFRALSSMATAIRHPYLSRIIGMHAVSATGTGIRPMVAISRPLSEVGSLRDYIYRSMDKEGALRAQEQRRISGQTDVVLPVGQPLPIQKLRLWGRQILEAMLALQRLGLRPIHVHAGNVMIVSNDDLRVLEREQYRRRAMHRKKRSSQNVKLSNRDPEEVLEFDENHSLYEQWDSHRIVLCGFENSLLGLPMSTPQLRRRIRKAHADGFSELEALIFGHLFFEMSFGVALDDVVPHYEGLDANRRVYTHPIRSVLDLIFEGGTFVYDTQNIYENNSTGFARSRLEVPFEAHEHNAKIVWRSHSSKHRLTVKKLCTHPFFNDFGTDCVASIDAFPRDALLCSDFMMTDSDKMEGAGNRSERARQEALYELRKKASEDGTTVDDMEKVIRAAELLIEKRWKRCIPKNRRVGAGTNTRMLDRKNVLKWANEIMPLMPKLKPRNTRHRHQRSGSHTGMLFSDKVKAKEINSSEGVSDDNHKTKSQTTTTSKDSSTRDNDSSSKSNQVSENQQKHKTLKPNSKPCLKEAKSASDTAISARSKTELTLAKSNKDEIRLESTKVPIQKHPPISKSGGRGALLAAIQAGKKLKKVEKSASQSNGEVQEGKGTRGQPSQGSNMMAMILAQRKAIIRK